MIDVIKNEDVEGFMKEYATDKSLLKEVTGKIENRFFAAKLFEAHPELLKGPAEQRPPLLNKKVEIKKKYDEEE